MAGMDLMADNGEATKEFFKRVGSSPVPRPRRGRRDDTAATPPQQPESATETASVGAKRWAANHDTFWGATQTYDELPAGLYRTGMSPNVGPILVQMVASTDNLLVLPDAEAEGIIAEFKRFWKLKAEFSKHGFLHKRGFLLWGPPGSGKTSCLQLLIKELIDTHGGIVLFLDHPGTAVACIQMARQIEPNRPIIAIMEDLDALIERHGEGEYLALLDGEAQVDNIVFVASTNYPELLDRRFVDRPSRFDTICYVGMPTADARRAYFMAKVDDVDEAELEDWVAATDGLSIAHLKELIIAVRCFGQSLHGKGGVAERLQSMHECVPSSDKAPDRRRAGILSFGSIGAKIEERIREERVRQNGAAS